MELSNSQALAKFRSDVAAVKAAEDEWDAIQIFDEEGFEHHVTKPTPDDVTTGDSKKRKTPDGPETLEVPEPKKAKTEQVPDPISGNADWVAYVDKSGEPLLSEFNQKLRSWAQVRTVAIYFLFPRLGQNSQGVQLLPVVNQLG